MNKKYPVNNSCPCGSGKKYKKCHGDPKKQNKTPLLRPAETNPTELIAYTDESGNSGNHLFDKNQPNFWTATLVTPANFEVIAMPIVTRCLKLVGKQELHGNALGLAGINKIAPLLIELIIETQSLFLFTNIEKTHLAGTKFADAVLDSGINQAVALFQYGPPAARLPLALQLIQLLEEEDLVEWWTAFEHNDANAFAVMMKKTLARLKAFHREGIYHDRTVEVLGDALTWGIAHPERLLEGGLSPLDSPNIVAITLIVGMLHSIHEDTGARVTKFIHDEQNQFAKHLQFVYGHSKRFSLDNSNICAPLPIVKSALTFGCEMEVNSSANCYGLQVVDTVLWLIKRFIDSKGEVRGEARQLALQIIKTGDISPFDRLSMIHHVESIMARLEALPITKQQIEKGKKLLTELEAKRIKRMNAPLED